MRIKKAVILAAGKGSRLGTESLKIPKPLMDVFGEPIIFHTIRNCARSGIEDIYINLFHLPEKFMSMIGNGSKFGIRVHYKVENSLLGTSGAVKNFESDLNGEPFVVIYGDNWTDYDFSEQMSTHQNSGADMSVVVYFKAGDVSQSGLAHFDETHRIVRFVEKAPDAVNGGWVNAGIYFIQPWVLAKIPNGFSDFGQQIIPDLIRKDLKLNAIVARGKLVAIDTPEMLAAAKSP
jgi:NDP-sugar pyrophosphorylase family protein